MIYIDCDLYQPTKIILDEMDSYLSKGGIFIFDEGLKKKWSEGVALKEFYNKNKKRYILEKINEYYQPDVILRKIK